MIELVCEIESDLERLEESRLAEESNAQLIHPGCEPGIDWNLNYSLQVNHDIRKMSRDIGASDSGGDFDGCGQGIQSQRLHKYARKDAMVGAGIDKRVARQPVLAMDQRQG